MELVKKVRKFLKDNKIDYLLVNSTNEFLVEYSEPEENARYALTKFSGSCGDAVISNKKVFLFVDGRYHKQADLEVDKKLVTVVKMKIGESFSDKLMEKLSPDSTFALVSKKNSQGRVEILERALKKKNIKIELLDFDPVLEKVNTAKNSKMEFVEDFITGMSTSEKIKAITAKLKDDEAILVTNLEEVSYICNLRDFSKNYSSKISCKCLITKGFWWKCPSAANLEQYLKGLHHINKIFVDKTTINAFDYSLLEKKAVPMKENFIKDMKSVKTQAEIDHYRECFEKTDKALIVTRNFIEKNENISENDIAKELEENFYRFGAKSLSFKSIVAKDKNSALAHYSANSKDEILKDGSLILIDCGAYYEGGYATDITRVFVKGTPSALQKEVYTKVLKAFLKAFNKKIKKDITGYALDKTARDYLNKEKPKGFEFSHSLGHGIGISVHEAPPSLACSPAAKASIKPNMCFTIEPGLYNPKEFGVRLENSCYLANENKNLIIKSFSNMCFEEKLIDFSLLSTAEKKQLKAFEVK